MTSAETPRGGRQQARTRELLAGIERLPSPPAVAVKVLQLAMNEAVSMEQVARQIVLDQALAMRVLAQAKAASLGVSGRVDDVEQACVLLGLGVLQNIALAVLVRETLLQEGRHSDPQLLAVWKHSLACAVTAGLIAEARFPRLKNAAFAAGMMHDCGRLALLTLYPAEYEPLLEQPQLDLRGMLQAEEERFGAGHALVGKWLASAWKLPQPLVEACWLHHHGPESLAGMEGVGPLPRIVALANLMAHEVMVDVYHPDMRAESQAWARDLGLDDGDMRRLAAAVGTGYAERAATFDLEADALRFYMEAAERARGRLSQAGLGLERQNVHLSRTNAVLDLLARAGCRLAECATTPALLVESARLLTSLPYTRGGCLYRITEPEGRFEGVLLQEGRLAPLRGRLDEAGRLDLAGAERLPQRLVRMLSGFAGRRTACGCPGKEAVPGIITAEGYCVLPLASKDTWYGELCFEPNGESAADAGQGGLSRELSGYVQLAGLMGACLGRLDQDERLEERAERLAEALRKLQQMHAKLLRTERLAAVGQLAAGAAHEINNPLAIIYARTQLLEVKEDDARKREILKLIMGQIERISGILTNLMDFARPAPPRFGSVDVNAILTRALNLAAGGLEKKGIALRRQLAQELPAIEGDSRQLEQVFLNLILNAEHAMAGGGTLTVRTWATRKPDRVMAAIRDTGQGIPRENLAKVFDPFFTTKEEGKGTGLGLSTSYGIVSSHGGEISLRSEVGKGTEVLVQLPLTQNGATAQTVRPPRRNAVMVVDVQGEIRDIIGDQLSVGGLELLSPATLADAMGMMSAAACRLVVLDMSVLRRAAPEVVDQFVASCAGQKLLVVGGRDEAQAAAALRPARFMAKPFQMETLLAALKELLADE